MPRIKISSAQRPVFVALRGKIARWAEGALHGEKAISEAEDHWATRWLTPTELQIWRKMPPPDRRHGLRVAAHVLQAMPAAPETLLAAALLHDCGKVGRQYRSSERVLAGLLPHTVAEVLPWPPAQAKAHHAIWGAHEILRLGGRAAVASLVARHHAPAGDPLAEALRAADRME